jgi:hypothetical protein
MGQGRSRLQPAWSYWQRIDQGKILLGDDQAVVADLHGKIGEASKALTRAGTTRRERNWMWLTEKARQLRRGS